MLAGAGKGQGAAVVVQHGGDALMLEPLTEKVTVTLSPARTLPEPEKLAPGGLRRYRQPDTTAAVLPAGPPGRMKFFSHGIKLLLLSWVVWYPGPAGTPEAGPYR